MKRNRFSMLVALILVGLMVISAGSAFGAQKVLLRLQQAYSSPLPILGTSLTWWAEQLME